MDWIKQLLAKHTDEDGKVSADAFLEEVTKEAPKHSVPKAEFNAKNEALKEAREDLEALQKNTGDVEALQQQITEANAKAAKADEAYAGLVKSTAIKDAITAAGGTDIDYLAYKLGDVEPGDVANKLKDLQSTLPEHYFAKPEGDVKEDKGGNGGYKTVDNKLNDGKPQTEADKMAAIMDAGFGLSPES